jgi:hypothetical protein
LRGTKNKRLFVLAGLAAIAIATAAGHSLTGGRVDAGTLFFKFSSLDEEHLDGKACKCKAQENDCDDEYLKKHLLYCYIAILLNC